ncbi:diguanylate cyclase (GGDEF) domain-containing protein [Stutzerimonas xanthomarina]|uniref:diguanylate cyclase n=3 Tax=Stutzerimonas xanthomarina TaxID=271420 RepID=A0A1M5MYQ2_9GAMM|nr:diguanylate cyclase (GGDEF) domain-containing protein [Stutzerimonas xanthomarina]SHG82335.1 diguanylate cyclase (GGDEF) domain-containing protein [Stutzerimonas xanthomarina DSM 18231]
MSGRTTEMEVGTNASAPQRRDETQQKLRMKRLGMASVSYMVTLSLVASFYYQSLIPLSLVFVFLSLSILLNASFFLVFHLNLNLRYKDPSLTLAQIVASLVPPLIVMYYLDAGQARAILLLIAVVPALYGILALNTRQFIYAVVIMVGSYLIVLACLWSNRPEALAGTLEYVQLFTLIVVLTQVALIGGYINSLRKRIRDRNLALNTAMEELNEALAVIRDMANRDDLTGLFNRRHLFDVLTKEVNRYQRVPGPFSVCMMDVDHFKLVNDIHGHQAGDHVLREVAANVQKQIRSIDCIGRWGGEEFLLVLPQTSIAGAVIKAERIRSSIEALRFPQIGEDFRVTVSLGVAEYHGDTGIEQTMALADAALYQAKSAGRNRVVSIDPTETAGAASMTAS